MMLCATLLSRSSTLGRFHRLLHYINQLHGHSKPCISTTSAVAASKNWKIVKTFDDVEFPPERRKLKFVDRQPQPLAGQKMPKVMKRLIDMRGPETVHNKLMHRQYGIRAKTGGRMHFGHFDMVRLGINRNMDDSRMFAEWRVDAPWKPITKKGQGHRMGGGKGAIDHYVTEIRAGRIIVEMGGHCEFGEVFPLLKRVAHKLPFRADVISQEMLDEERENEKHVEAANLNPFDFKYCLENNMLGCKKWAGTYDYVWFGKYR